MDPAVDLVTIYLQLNGYFVQTELPVLGRVSRDPLRYEQITDVDMLAVRFPGRGQIDMPEGIEYWVGIVPLDASLGVDKHEIDLIIGEVKEGPSRLNKNLRNPGVLRAVLLHAGGVLPVDADEVIDKLIETGDVRVEGQRGDPVRIRMIVFGRTKPAPRLGRPYHVVPHEQTLSFVWNTLHTHRELFRVIQAKNHSLALLRMIERSIRAENQPKRR